MPALIESDIDRKSLRQDLSDYFTFLQHEETPELSILPKTTVNQTKFQDQVDDYGDTSNIEGVLSNDDATSFTNQLANMGYVENFAMKMRETAAVDDMAQNVDENPALASGYMAQAVRKAVVRLKHRMAKQILSLIEGRQQSGANTYRSCAIGGFIKSGAPSGDQAVPSIARPAAAQIYTDTVANLQPGGATPIEGVLKNIMQEIYEASFGQGNFKAIFGSSLKKLVSDISIYEANVSGATVVRRINSDNDAEISATVDRIKGDFGAIDIIPSVRVRRVDASNAAVSDTLARNSGYILDPQKWGLAFKRTPNFRSLEDKGGGPRGIVEAIYGLRALFPKGNGAILPAS